MTDAGLQKPDDLAKSTSDCTRHSNIAEGCGRGSDADFRRFLLIAMGSANEVEYQLLLAHELGYVNANVYQQVTSQIIELKRMMNGFIRRLQAKN